MIHCELAQRRGQRRTIDYEQFHYLVIARKFNWKVVIVMILRDPYLYHDEFAENDNLMRLQGSTLIRIMRCNKKYWPKKRSSYS